MKIPRYQETVGIPEAEAPKMSPNLDFARALSGAGSQLLQTADDLARVAIAQKDKRDAVEFERARVDLLTQRNNLLLGLTKDPDFDSFGEKFESFGGEMGQALSELKVSKEVRTRLEAYMPAFLENTRFDVAKLQLTKEFDHIKGQGLDLYSQAVANSDPESMNRALQTMVGVVDESEITRLHREGQREIEWNVNVSSLNTDSFSWEADKEAFPTLSEADWTKLNTMKKQLFTQAEAEYQESVQYQLNDLLESGALTSGMVEKFSKPNEKGMRGVSPQIERLFKGAIAAKAAGAAGGSLAIPFPEAMNNFNAIRSEIRNAAREGKDFSDIDLKVRLMEKAGLITGDMQSTLMTLVRDEKEFSDTLEKSSFDIGMVMLEKNLFEEGNKIGKYIPEKDKQAIMELYAEAGHAQMTKGTFSGMDGAKLATSVLVQKIDSLDLNMGGSVTSSGWMGGFSVGLNNLGEGLADVLEYTYGMDPTKAKAEVIKIEKGFSALSSPLPEIFDDLIPVPAEGAEE